MESNLKKNYFFNLFYKIVTLLTPLITAPFISRVLGSGGIGEYSYTFSIAHFFLIFAALGVSDYGSRSIARVKDDEEEKNKVFSEIFVMQFSLGIILVALYLGYSFIFAEDRNLSLIQGMNLLATMFDITWFLFGMELFVVTTIRNVIIKLLGVAAILVFVRTENDVWLYAVIMAGSTLAGQLSVWPILGKYVKFRKPSVKGVFSHLKPNLILFLPVIANNLLGYFDKVMIGSMIAKTELGWYDNAEKMLSMPNSLVTALGAVMLPRVTNSIAHGKAKEVKKMTDMSMLFTSFMVLALAFGIAAVAKEFTPIFFGEGFDPVTPMIYILAPYMVSVSWASVLKTQCLLPNNKDKTFVACLIAGAVLNVVMNYFLIPVWGAFGAAAATTIAETLICVLEVIALRRMIDYKKYILDALPFLLFGALMALGIWFLDTGNMFVTLFVKMAVGAVIYLVLSGIYIYKFHNEAFRIIFKKKKRN